MEQTTAVPWSRFTQAMVCMLLMLVALSSMAEDVDGWEAAVSGLAAKSLREREAALAALLATDDERVLPLLEALNEGRLLSRGNTLLVEAADGRLLDAATMNEAAPGEKPRKITINNQMRVTLAEGLALFRLRTGDRGERLRALQGILERPPDPVPAGLRAMLEVEHDAELRAALEAVIALGDLRSGDPARQLAAISLLAQSMLPEVYNRLAELERSAGDEAVRKAAATAREALDGRRAVHEVVQTAYFGLSLGAVFALCAIGLAITFGVMGVINMAHGEMMMIGAYATWLVQQGFPGALEYSLLIALPVAFLTAAVMGLLIEWLVVSRLYGRPLETLLATFGLSLMLQQSVRSLFGATNQAVSSPAWMSGSFQVTEGLEFTWGRLYIIVFSLLVFGALALVMRATRLGLQIRAVSQNRSMARALGIPSRRVDGMTFALGSGIAGLAGVALSQLTNVGPNLGQSYIVDAFMVVVFGGVGSLWGTLVAGLGLGMLTKLLEPTAGAVLGKVLVLVGIIVFIQRYPKGLFPMRGRSLEP